MLHSNVVAALALCSSLILCQGLRAQGSSEDESEDFIGHSGHGEAYDVGPRQKPG